MNKDIEVFHKLKENRTVVSSRLVLMILWNKNRFGLAGKEVRETAGISAAMLSQVLKELDEQGYIDRQQSYRDKRVSRIYLSKKGHKFATEIWENINALAALQPRRANPDVDDV